jgi:hypothetical protein
MMPPHYDKLKWKNLLRTWLAREFRKEYGAFAPLYNKNRYFAGKSGRRMRNGHRYYIEGGRSGDDNHRFVPNYVQSGAR